MLGTKSYINPFLHPSIKTPIINIVLVHSGKYFHSILRINLKGIFIPSNYNYESKSKI